MATTPDMDVPTLDIREQVARIDRMQAELARWQLENLKTSNEIAKIAQEMKFAPLTLAATAFGAGAAMFAAAAAFLKLMS